MTTTSQPSKSGSSSSNIGPVLERMKKTVAEGNYYEAQQLIKTLYFRYDTQHKSALATELLVSGATTMLQHNQSTCASELCQMLLQLYTRDHVTPDSNSIGTITKIANLFPPGDQGKISLLKSALKWAVAEGTQKQGDPYLHAQLAKAYAEAGEYAYAQKYYLNSNEPKEFDEMLIKWANEGYPSERDLYIARSVLMYLSMSNLRDANIIFQTFTNSLSTNQVTPLINFLKFLLLTLERDAYPLFDVLRQKYKASLSRDPSFPQYLDHIAQVFYKVKPAAVGMGGGLGGLGGPGFGNFISDLFKNIMSPATADLEIDADDAD